MDAETGTAIGTVILAISTFAMVFVTHQTMEDARKRSKIEEKKKELRDQEEAYSRFMGLETSTALVFQHRCQIGVKEWVATYSEESIKNIHDVWLSVTLQNAYEAEREYSRHIRYFWEAMGLILTRFENTKELTDLFKNVVHLQNEFRDKFINNAPPKSKGLTRGQLEKWAKQMDDDFYSFNNNKLNPAFDSVLKYLRNEINKVRIELTQMEGEITDLDCDSRCCLCKMP